MQAMKEGCEMKFGRTTHEQRLGRTGKKWARRRE
jgi:hypothetical protein